MSELLFRTHLGLGDALISNAIVRDRAAKHKQVVVLCKPNNVHTLNFLWRDVPSIETFVVEDDHQANEAVETARTNRFDVLVLGSAKLMPGGAEDFDLDKFDREFYRLADIPFQQRWNGFICARQPSRELEIPKGNFCLLHEDKKRGYTIDRTRLPKLPIVAIDPALTPNLFDWWGHMENATEIHMIDSSPIILADSLPTLKASRLVWHFYARPDGRPPCYCKDWQKLS